MQFLALGLGSGHVDPTLSSLSFKAAAEVCVPKVLTANIHQEKNQEECVCARLV